MNPASRDGAAALDDVRAFIGRFCALPTEHAYTAATLWAAHAHVLDAFDSTPRLAFLSPEPGSGKTRALEILTLLVPWPMHAVNATPAALFRSVVNLGLEGLMLIGAAEGVAAASLSGKPLCRRRRRRARLPAR